jgi:Ca-activated chloride channel family protein
MGLEFESPYLLLLLLVVPAVLLVLRYTLLDSPKAQLAASAGVRVAIVLLLVLALANALWVSKGKHVAVLVLADLSDSVPQTAPVQVCKFLAELEKRVSNPGKAGLATFAAAARIYHPVENHPKFQESLAKPEDRGETSIEKALLLAREAMPTDTVNRVVLFTDGNETTGDALSAAKRIAAHGIRVYPVPYEADEKDEILLEDLVVPAEVKRGQSFTISAAAHATAPGKAMFTLYRDGFKIQEKELELKEGANALTFEESNPADGLTKYELRVKADKDFYADNNVSSGVVFVAGEPRVLLLEGDEREARHLVRALEAENIRVEAREGKGMPGSLEELAAFDAVIFSDVPATDVSVRQMELLRSYIEDLGGGFIMIGGEESFGLGGYYRTTIEDALPVRMRSEKKKDTPSLAMMLIIDRSGSMQGEKVQLAKEAAIAAVEVLGDRDYVGVVAFDSEPYWIVDLQSASNRVGIIQSIESIEANGGTSIYPALEVSHEALSGVPASFKHAIVLTDGQSQPGDFAGIVDRMVNEQITVSTVAVGEGADVTLLQDMARWGKGRYYFTADPYDIPQIFTKETMTASKSSLVEEPFLPQVFRAGQVIQGVDWESAPFLFGYVVTSPKSTADVMLVTERGDPLLVGWRFGLGKTAAFTSDAKSRWAADWLGWPGYGKFWAQVVRDTMRTSHSRGSETRIALSGNKGRIVIDNADENGNFINGLESTVQLIDPTLAMKPISLAQTAPGRYEAEFDADRVGSYLFKVRQAIPGTAEEGEAGDALTDYTRALTISYKPEYRHLSTNEAFLKELATASGGNYAPQIDELFAVSDNEAVPIRTKLWPPLLIAALVLFLLDVALRRMDLAGWRLFGEPQRYG